MDNLLPPAPGRRHPRALLGAGRVGPVVRGPSLPVLLVGCLVAAHPACSPEAGPGPQALWLADLVTTQERNVSTDLVSVPDQVGLDALVYGWEPVTSTPAGEEHVRLSRRVGRVELFSADGDLSSVALEIGLPDDGPESVRLLVLLNARQVGRLRVRRGWTRREVAVRPGVARVGRNILTFRSAFGRRGDPSGSPVRLRRLRVASGRGRPAWSGRPRSIVTPAGDPASHEKRDVDMPVASFADVVLRVPDGAGIFGQVGAERADAGQGGDIEAYIRLLDEGENEHSLFVRRTGEGEAPVAVDLSRWAGQLVRIRWGATGPGNGLVRWRATAIRAREPITGPSLPPIVRAEPVRSGRLGRPDVVLVLLDAARADAFSPFGGPHPSPALERLAAHGTVFEDAMSSASWTGQSVPAILTGLSADALGIGGWGGRVAEGVPTLADLASKAGYRTVLWSQHPFYFGNALAERFAVATNVSDKGYDALPRMRDLVHDEGPTLALVHLIPPHMPYTPPPPFLGSFSSWYSGEQAVDGPSLNQAAREGLSAEDRRYAFDRYLENAAYADHLVGRILSDLDRTGRYDAALVIVLSDHGEGFMEHGEFLHAGDVHRESVHVPLVVKWPAGVRGFAPRVASPVSLLDLVPTLVDGLALPGGGAGFMGRDLLPVALDGEGRDDAVYSVTRGMPDSRNPPNPRLMLQLRGWRVQYAPLPDATQLYRVAEDPGETHDVAAEEPLQALRLRQAVLAQSAWNRSQAENDEEAAEPIDDPEILRRLEALGYVN